MKNNSEYLNLILKNVVTNEDQTNFIKFLDSNSIRKGESYEKLVNMYPFLNEVSKDFLQKNNEEIRTMLLRRKKAPILSSIELSKDMLTVINKILSAKFTNFVLDPIIDTSLTGGFRFIYGGKIYDYSLDLIIDSLKI
jgi:F0F1-type ATP synthase delta subunit